MLIICYNNEYNMCKFSKKQKELVKRILTYFTMVVTIVVTVLIMTFIMLGYRLNISNGQIEQYAFLQFNTIPSGASIYIDDANTNHKTPNRDSIKPGKHKFVMKKDGYETWTKTIDTKAGIITWLNYVLLVPKNIETQKITDYSEIYSSSTSPKNKNMLIQFKSDTPSFDLVNLDTSGPDISSLIIPSSVYSEPDNNDIVHIFELNKWDVDGRYILIKHTYGDKYEWLVIDTQNVSQSKNITKLFDISITDIEFSGNSGNIYFVIEENDIRKLDLSAETMSRSLVNNVKSMSVFESNIIAYEGYTSEEKTNRIIGLYRDGDENTYILKELNIANDVNVKIKTAHYFNQDYIVYSEGNNVIILGGIYPTTLSDAKTSLSLVESFESESDITDLSFSPTGEFVLVKSNISLTSYDLEYKNLSTFDTDCSNPNTSVGWLNDNYLWSTCNDSLVIREFDGANAHTINPSINNQTVALTKNSKYIYSLKKSDSGYQLLRAVMIKN